MNSEGPNWCTEYKGFGDGPSGQALDDLGPVAARSLADTAARVAAVRERLMARRYGPPGTAAGDQALVAEVETLVHRLGGSLRSWGGRAVATLLMLAWCSGSIAAQAPAPEGL